METWDPENRDDDTVRDLQAALLCMLRMRFGMLPRPLEAHVSATTDVHTLGTWLDDGLGAETLAEVGIPMD